jgi:hypothetical protein
MKGEPKAEGQRPSRWDSYPLGYVTPRWDAGVRYWPGVLMLVGIIPLSVAVTIAFGFTYGWLVTGAVIAIYPALLILLPLRKRLVPREVGTSTSPVPLRLWVLGWLLVAAGVACAQVAVNVWLNTGSQLLAFGADSVEYALFFSGMFLVMRAPSWVQWRQRPRKRRRHAPRNGGDASSGTALEPETDISPA